MKRKLSIWLPISFFLFLLISSCTEVINLDLNSSDPQIIIEGSVATNSNQSIVKLSRSMNFYEPNNFPTISGAMVQISDDQGTIVELTEISSGVYVSEGLTGIEGTNYNLSVSFDNFEATASCEIPPQVKFDSLMIDQVYEDAFFGGGSDTLSYQIKVGFTDLPNENNYYLFIEYINGEKVQTHIMSDRNRDGMSIEQVLRFSDREINGGDVLEIEMRCISKEIYKFFQGLSEMERNGPSSTPSNPANNIQGNALGYFSAHTSEFKQLIVPAKIQ